MDAVDRVRSRRRWIRRLWSVLGVIWFLGLLYALSTGRYGPVAFVAFTGGMMLYGATRPREKGR